MISSLEICPGIEDGGVTRADLDAWEAEFGNVCSLISPLFHRPEPGNHARQYLRGLLAPIQRKNGWTIAEYSGEKEPKAMQRFLNLTPWDGLSPAFRNRLLVHALGESGHRPPCTKVIMFMRAVALRNPRARVISALTWELRASARPLDGPPSRVASIGDL